MKSKAYASSVPPETREYIDALFTERLTPLMAEITKLKTAIARLDIRLSDDVSSIEARVNRSEARAAEVNRVRGSHT